jgi:pyruvate dehydrogenase E2 component (dihydrolipoamide acetyltransferase)
MPKLGNTVEDCLLAGWLKHKGDAVAAGDVIAEIETDKTSFELTAPVAGVLLDTFFPAGALVPVFTVIAAIGSPGEAVDGLAPRDGGAGAAQASAGGAGTGAAALPGAGAGERPAVPGPAAVAAPAAGGAGAAHAPLSPRARRFAREHDLAAVPEQGSGPGGRVVEDDLRRLWYSSPRSAPASGTTDQAEQPGGGPAPAVIATTTAPGSAAVVAAAAGTEKLPMSPVRERIAKRLRGSVAATVQYTLNTSANAGGLLALRKAMKASPATEGVNIGDLVAYCTIRALLDVPDLNAELIDGVVYRHSKVHMGFACDTPRGLVVPVVRDSQDLSLVGLSRHMKDLAARAVQGSVTVDELNGGTFTVSNLGSMGIESFTPLLNPPQVAILGVGAIGLKPARKADGNVEFVDAIGLSLTVDHQVVDGAPGARFLAVVRDKIEHAEAICTI